MYVPDLGVGHVSLDEREGTGKPFPPHLAKRQRILGWRRAIVHVLCQQCRHIQCRRLYRWWYILRFWSLEKTFKYNPIIDQMPSAAHSF